MKHTRMLLCRGNRTQVIMLVAALFLTHALQAADWYVKAAASAGGNGGRNRPFSSLQEVETASAAGDTIFVLQSPSGQVLNGGIQLKDGQRLIGLGPKVTEAAPNSARAKLTNTFASRYDGDVVRLAKMNVVENIHFDNAYRSSIFGINANGAIIRDNLVTNDMAAHDLFTIEGPAPSVCSVVNGVPGCAGEWPNGFIIFAPQVNHFGAVNLVACGPAERQPRPDPLLRPESYCEALVPGSGSTTSPVRYEIRGNIVRDGNSDGFMLINDTGVQAMLDVCENTVLNLSLPLPDPSSVGITDHVVRSRGITVITCASTSNLELNDFRASNLAPVGTFASDGIVFLAVGQSPVVNGNLEHVLIDNPYLTGEAANGDSIEIQHRASINGLLNIQIKDAVLKDPANSNIKIIDSGNPLDGIYRISVLNSALSNINTTGNEDAQIHYLATAPGTKVKELSLRLKNVTVTGLGRGIGTAPTGNSSDIGTLNIKVEDSSFTGLTDEPIQWISPATRTTGLIGGAVIDLGGGPLGSQGRNRFLNNGVPGYVPPGADPTGIDTVEAGLPVEFDADVSVTNDRPLPNPPIDLWLDNNYWGGGPPVISTTKGQDVDVYVPTGSNVSVHAPASYLSTDPKHRARHD